MAALIAGGLMGGIVNILVYLPRIGLVGALGDILAIAKEHREIA